MDGTSVRDRVFPPRVARPFLSPRAASASSHPQDLPYLLPSIAARRLRCTRRRSLPLPSPHPPLCSSASASASASAADDLNPRLSPPVPLDGPDRLAFVSIYVRRKRPPSRRASVARRRDCLFLECFSSRAHTHPFAPCCYRRRAASIGKARGHGYPPAGRYGIS